MNTNELQSPIKIYINCEMLVFRRKLLGEGEIRLDEGQRLTKYKREVTTLIGMCDGPLHVCAMRGIKAGR